MSNVTVISDDNEVLEYSELFGIKERLEKFLKDRTECTLLRQMDKGNGIISVFIFSVHTLEGDSGFSCLIFPDKSKHIDDIRKFLEFKIETTGASAIKNEGSIEDFIIGQG